MEVVRFAWSRQEFQCIVRVARWFAAVALVNEPRIKAAYVRIGTKRRAWEATWISR
jgi:hypothetical protein